MSQAFTDNLYEQSSVADTTLTNMENNFAALKSAFSGGSAPSNPVAGMPWFDTTANLLKIRNEANSAWLNVWDLANNKPVITNLSDEITVAMIAASAKDPAVGTAGLRTIGTGAVQAAAGNDSRFSTVPDNYVTMEKIQHGSIMLPAFGGTGNTDVASWSSKITWNERVYIPADATTLTMSIQINTSANLKIAYCRFLIGGLYSDTVDHNTTAFTWKYPTRDVSSLSGWYPLYVQIMSSQAGFTATCQHPSFIWE